MELEEGLHQAHLLSVRNRFEEAKTLLLTMDGRYPGNPEVQYLLARIRATEQAEESENERRRALRYRFRMDTAWRRFVLGLVSAGIAFYSAWGELTSLQQGFSIGFATVVTTTHQTKGGPTTYTRPIYFDVVLYALLFVLVVFVHAMVWYLARGAAQWEELNPSSDDYHGL